MALPVSFDADLSVAPQNSYHPAMKSSGGNFYTVLRNTVAAGGTNQFSLHKATDPTSSFSEVDTNVVGTGGDAILSLWCFQKDNDVDVVVQNAARDVHHSVVDISGDSIAIDVTVETIITADGGPNANACSVARESTGSDIVVAYQGDPDMVMGTEYARIDANRSDDNGANWGGPISVDNAGPDHWTGPVIVLGSSDRMHIFFKNDDLSDGFQRTLRSDDTLETFPSTFDNNASESGEYLYGHGIGGSSVNCPYGKAGDLGFAVFFTSEDTPSPSITNLAGGANHVKRVPIGNYVHGMAADGTDLHYMYSIDSDSDLWRDENTGSGWGVDIEVLDAITCNHVSPNSFDRSGPKLAYIYDDGGTVKYNEVSLVAAPIPTINLVMAPYIPT